MTPSGMRKPEIQMSMPAMASMVDVPPSISMEETMVWVAMPKNMKTECAVWPQRTSMSSRNVCALGALRLISIAMMPKRMIWTDAPAAYQKGPVTPYCHATLDDWSSVAAQVHCETMTEAVRPVLTLRPAVLKCSEVISTPANFCSTQVRPIVATVNKAAKKSMMKYPSPSVIIPFQRSGLSQLVHDGLYWSRPRVWPMRNHAFERSGSTPSSFFAAVMCS
mmetsp:Transcript_1976/g.4435  ORF Transcript_1976/g.4435 Transcript_1976/m.4435 type:complete len:221 (+) Transcript_1976:350-1012(+)